MLVKILFLVLLFFNNKYCFAIDIDKEKSNQIISESNFIKDDKILDEKKSDDKMIEKSIFDKVDKIEHINKIQKYKIKINFHNVGVYK